MWSELSLKIAWDSNIMNSHYQYSAKEKTAINIKHNLIHELTPTMARSERKAVAKALDLVLLKEFGL